MIAAGAVAVTRRPRAIGAISLCTISMRPVAVLAEAFTARRKRPFLASAVARCVRFFVAELPVGKSRGRARIAAIGARGVGALLAARSIPIIAARRRAFTLAGVGFARTRIGFFVIGFGAVGFKAVGLAGIRTPLAFALAGKVLAGEATFGELLLRPSGSPRAALAASGAALAVAGPITP